jgi:hypothetical protein
MELSAKILANAHMRLEPFEERHRDGLIAAAHGDVSIFRHMPVPVAAEGRGAWFDARDVVFSPQTIVGSPTNCGRFRMVLRFDLFP